MRTFIYSMLAVGALALTAAAQNAPVGPGSIKLDKVSPSVVKTPEFQITGGQNKRYTLGQWLEVEVEYETKADMIDELTFSYKILVNGKLLVGDMTYVEIPKGREHYAVAYVAPRTLENLMGNHPLTAAAIQGIWVDVNHQGQVLGQTSMQKTPVPNLPQVGNLILRKDQTPFASLYWDRYEALKPKSNQ
jgi:hypothetical protein